MQTDSIVAALAKDPVYVADGASESPTIHDDITQVLAAGDGIKVVLLPVDSTDSLTATAASIESEMPVATTLIVARGNDVAVVSNIVPTSTAQGILAQAGNVSSNGLDTIRTFVGNLHDWQAAHPNFNTATAEPDQPFFATPIPYVAGGGIIIAVVAVVIIAKLSRRRSADDLPVAGLPRELRPLIVELSEYRSKIKSVAMKGALADLSEYAGDYHRRVDDSAGKLALHSQLNDALQICRVYLDMEKKPKYYEQVTVRREQGESAINGLSASILNSIRQGNSKSIFDYQMNSKILGAQRYR